MHGNGVIKMNKNRRNAIIVGILILYAYAVLASNVLESKVIVMILEALSGIAVIGIAAIMFPLFKSYNVKASFGYLALRFIEGAIMIVGGILFFINTQSLLTLRDQIYVGHAYIFVVAALIFYYLLYQSKIVPRFISIWGIIASVLVLIPNLLNINTTINIILLLPIISNEVFLAIWLIVKGFNIPLVKTK
jgi:hypothetical protein